jgi:FAD/FMN-containing dehydrogenase
VSTTALLERARDDLASRLAALPPGVRVRLAKRTSNLFRARAEHRGPVIDAAPFARVLRVDPERRVADVGGMTTYEDLVAATLPHRLMPLVVPQLKTITLGGAVSGVGIESSSFRHGLPHESVIGAEIITGSGEIVLARREGPDSDLYFGLPNSYGTLGYAVRLRIELMPVRPFVRLEHRRFGSAGSLVSAVSELVADPSVDFLDGVAFSPDELYLTVGRMTDAAPYTSDYTGLGIYYRSIRERAEDFLTIHDYIWRWDTDWFWCSRAFGVQRPAVRALWPRRWRRSDVYWRLIALDGQYGISDRIDRALGRPRSERVVQDVQVPLDKTPEFLAFLDRQTRQRPVWLCPFRVRDGATTWPLFPLDPARTYVNVGFWGTARLPAGASDGHHNRAIERTVGALGGAKSLYSTSFYEREEFHRLYGGETYDKLKVRYDSDGRMGDLYDKTVGRR